MATAKTTIGLTAAAREICEDLQERLRFKELGDMRDFAIAHAIRTEIEPKKVQNTQTIWSSTNVNPEIVATLDVFYPDEAAEDVYGLYQNLANLGLLALGQDKNYRQWKEISHLPGIVEK
jgi:hypothetical protein